MKGITPIIAIIVLLLITVAMAGAGWTYLSGYTEGLVSKQIYIVDSFCVGGDQAKIVVKNTGTGTLRTGDVLVIDKATGNGLGDQVTWESNDKDPGLVLYLDFNSPGDPLRDKSMNGNDGTLNGNPIWVANGKIGGAYDFDGDDDAIYIPYDASLTPSQFTISIWAKSDVDELSALYRSAGGNGWSSSFAITQSLGGDSLFRWGDGTNPDGSIAIAGDSTGWRHIIGMYDGSTMTMIVNGTYQGDDTTVVFSYGTTQDAWIGESSGVEEFDGMIDEVRLYNRILTPDEIDELASAEIRLEPTEMATMTHTCSSGTCNYALTAGSTSAQVRIIC
jgi:flagellin-like protein